MSDALPDEDVPPESPKSFAVDGHMVKLSTGSEIWAGRLPKELGEGIAFRFTSKEGFLTKLFLSEDAARSLILLAEKFCAPKSFTYDFSAVVGENGGSADWVQVDPPESTNDAVEIRNEP